MKRIFTVLCPFDPVKRDVAGRIIKPLCDANIPELEIVVVSRVKFGFNYEDDRVKVVEIDDETAESDCKTRNFVMKKFFNEYGGSDGWLYMMDDSIEITRASGFETFFNDLERMLEVFGMNAWLNTRTDEMNFVFEVYNPRYTVEADDDIMKTALRSDRPVHWTSHANTSFMAVNLKNTDWQHLLFDEEFTVPMYYIIDWICRQRELNEKLEQDNPALPRWHFMNLYPSVDSEGDLFTMTDWKKLNIDENSWREPGYKQDPGHDTFERERVLFDSRNHNVAATMNPDPAFRMMYKRFQLAEGKNENNA